MANSEGGAVDLNPVEQAGIKRPFDAAFQHINASESSASAFRNVSACNRCRVRKNRCDQRLPRCTTCEKANVRCVGYDPITKREIPRSYVYYIEKRVSYLEALLKTHEIEFDTPEDFLEKDVRGEFVTPWNPARRQQVGDISGTSNDLLHEGPNSSSKKDTEQSEKLNTLVSNIGMVSVQGATDAQYLGTTSGISFARVVLAAVKSSVSSPTPEQAIASRFVGASESMRDSYFGLRGPAITKPAPFPDKDVGLQLAHLYFERINPTLPVLHRTQFMEMFSRVYAVDERSRTAQELYTMNIVFASAASVLLAVSRKSDQGDKRLRTTPEAYHASAISHLGSSLSQKLDSEEKQLQSLSELQSVLLLAGHALIRPINPGLWYIVGVAVRLAIDLGLHYEEPSPSPHVGENAPKQRSAKDAPSIPGIDRVGTAQEPSGAALWARDMRRRLWWCVYSLDRQVSSAVGRPFGIPDYVITTDFPSLLDDDEITPMGFAASIGTLGELSYKHASVHWFRMKILQSEILQVHQCQEVHGMAQADKNEPQVYLRRIYDHKYPSEPGSFLAWRRNMEDRLDEWLQSIPKLHNVLPRSHLELELEYWQTVVLLLRQSTATTGFSGGDIAGKSGSQPAFLVLDYRPFPSPYEDPDVTFIKLAEAAQKVLKLYRQLHRQRLIYRLYLATHQIFMAGIAFLYAVWHSPSVRQKLTLDDFDFTVLAAVSVLGDLLQGCPPAETCRDAFERMAKITFQACATTTGFGRRPSSDNLSDIEGMTRNESSASTHQVTTLQGSSDARGSVSELRDLYAHASKSVLSDKRMPEPFSFSDLPNTFSPSAEDSSFQLPYGRSSNVLKADEEFASDFIIDRSQGDGGFDLFDGFFFGNNN